MKNRNTTETKPISQPITEDRADVQSETKESKRKFVWSELWKKILQAGLGERFLRVGSATVSILLLFIFVWLTGNFLTSDKIHLELTETPAQPIYAVSDEILLPYFDPAFQNNEYLPINSGIFRFSQIHSELPAKARNQVLKYTVQEKDTVIGIGEKFNLRPSTILWGNPYTLSDDPHALQVGMELNILPTDGVYYEWHDGDGLNGVAKVFEVAPETIVDYPANQLSDAIVGDYANPAIKPGTWLVIPGGSRAFANWSAPFITRENPAVASIYGPGACQAVMDGPLGSGTFIWPSTETWISGYDYNEDSNHRAIDVAGSLGNPIYAADHGVIVYAGWNNHGYGNVVMIDHGNGWQTLYAHLDSYNVQCGYYVQQGDIIGGLGTTGNSSGPHLHYEMRYNGVPLNPHNFY